MKARNHCDVGFHLGNPCATCGHVETEDERKAIDALQARIDKAIGTALRDMKPGEFISSRDLAPFPSSSREPPPPCIVGERSPAEPVKGETWISGTIVRDFGETKLLRGDQVMTFMEGVAEFGERLALVAWEGRNEMLRAEFEKVWEMGVRAALASPTDLEYTRERDEIEIVPNPFRKD